MAFKKYPYPKKDKTNNKFKTTTEKNNESNTPQEKEITDWFYMTPNEINAKNIAEIFKLQSKVQVDLWEDMNILQVELGNKQTVDFEPMDLNFKDPSDATFIKNRDIKTIFSVTIEDGGLKEAIEQFKFIINEFDGFLCADTVNFQPLYNKENL